MWKPGQIVTINSKRYRVKCVGLYSLPCTRCEFLHNPNDICDSICYPDETSKARLDEYCYLELIRGKAESPTK